MKRSKKATVPAIAAQARRREGSTPISDYLHGDRSWILPKNVLEESRAAMKQALHAVVDKKLQQLEVESNRRRVERPLRLAAKRDRPMDPAAEHLSLYRPRSLPGVELWSIRNSLRQWTVLESNYTFGVAERLGGDLVWHSEGRAGVLSMASTILVEPGELQLATRVDGPVDLDFLMVDPAAVQREFGRDLTDEARPHHFGASRLEDVGLVGQFRRLWRTILDAQSDALELQVLFRSYLHALFDRARSRAAPSYVTRCDTAIEHIRSMIHSRHGEPLTLQRFATETNLSKSYLGRSFHYRFGLSIHRYLRRVRVARALDMLRQGVRPVVVSRKVGFSSGAHMARVFRDELGETPSFFSADASGVDLSRAILRMSGYEEGVEDAERASSSDLSTDLQAADVSSKDTPQKHQNKMPA
jgi:AraC-like DNA-binding protein